MTAPCEVIVGEGIDMGQILTMSKVDGKLYVLRHAVDGGCGIAARFMLTGEVVDLFNVRDVVGARF